MALLDKWNELKKRCFDAYVLRATLHTYKMLVAWITLPAIVTVLSFWIAGLPPIETDLSSGSYLKSDGIISTRYSALTAAQQYEENRAAGGGIGRRLALSKQPERLWAEFKIDIYYRAGNKN
jgi:hypothetical protein